MTDPTLSRRSFFRLGTLVAAPLSTAHALPTPAPAPPVVVAASLPVMGLRYHAFDAVGDMVAVDSQLVLKREVGNGYDPQAVAVMVDNHRIGYVPRGENHAIAALLEGGRRLVAQVIERHETVSQTTLRPHQKPWPDRRILRVIEVDEFGDRTVDMGVTSLTMRVLLLDDAYEGPLPAWDSVPDLPGWRVLQAMREPSQYRGQACSARQDEIKPGLELRMVDTRAGRGEPFFRLEFADGEPLAYLDGPAAREAAKCLDAGFRVLVRVKQVMHHGPDPAKGFQGIAIPLIEVVTTAPRAALLHEG